MTSRRALRRDEVFGKLLCLLDVERAKTNANSAPTEHMRNADELSNDAFVADNHQIKVVAKNETINVPESIQVCMKEKEQTQSQIKDNENLRNENIEVKAQGDAVKDQLQHDGRAKTQLEALEKQIEEYEIELKKQLQEKNDRIQFLESKQKVDKEKLQNLAREVLVIKDLENQLKEKNARIQTLEKMVGNFSHGDTLQKIASKFQQKNDRIKDLEEKLQQMTKKLQEGK